MEKMMAKGKANPNWKRLALNGELVAKALKLGVKKIKSLTTLCQDGKRLKKDELSNVPTESKTGFIELKNRELSTSGIFLECKLELIGL